MSRWIVRAIVSLAVLAVLLALIPLGSVIDALRRVSPWVWMASLAIFFAGHYANAVKLRLLVGPAAPSTSVMVQAQYAGLAANLGLPGLAGGDLVRAAYLVPAVGIKRVGLASLADRLIDTATLVVLILLALPLAGVPPAMAGIVHDGRWWLGALAAGGVIAAASGWWLTRRTRVAGMLGEAWRGLATRRSSLAAAVVISIVVQGAFVMTNVWLARQVGVATGLAAWFVAWPLSKLVAVLPISLGGLGVREAALVTLLAPYGADGTAVLASGLLWQAVLAVSGLAGLAFTQMLRRKSTSGVVVPASDDGKRHPTSILPSSGKIR